MVTTLKGVPNPTPATQQNPTTLDASVAPSDTIGRAVVWPLIVGGGVLAVAWTAWEVASGKKLIDAISIAASGLAAFALSVISVALTIGLLIKAIRAFTADHPRFLSLDWLVPLAALFGFLLGLAVWR
jgi:hypothetical protein